MKRLNMLLLGAAGLMASAAAPAIAQSAESVSDAGAEQEIRVTAEPSLLYPAAGQMNDHMHRRGELMIGVRLERSRFSGLPQHGTRDVGEEELVAAGYMMRGKVMTMDMVMLDLMYAPTDQVTLTLSPQYVWNRMTMVGFAPMGGMGGAMAMGEMKDASDGFGDTLAAASFSLADRPDFKALATVGVWIPTGAVDRKNDMGTLLDYCMQLGSGTWDLEPSATISGTEGFLGWGVQAAYRWRAESRNDAGFRFGDRARLSGWLSYLVAPSLGLTARAELSSQGRVKGEFQGPHYDMMSPSDRPENYGGEVLAGSIGANWQLPWSAGRGPQLGVEVGVPLYQNLNGVQMPQKLKIAASVRHTF